MSDMIAKASQAIIACGKAGSVSPVDYARAVIQAMRQPTQAMIEAAGNCEITVATFEYNYEGYVSEKEASAVWRSMIDAALKTE